MRLLDRYVLREFLVPLGYCLAGFLIFWIAFDLFSELHTIQEKHLLAFDVAEYYFFRIPEFLPVALPVALLLALLYALTNHARHNELTAMRAAGVSLGRLCAPYACVGLAASVGLFGLNEFCAPKSADVADQILVRRLPRAAAQNEQQPARATLIVNSRQHRFWHFGLYNSSTGEMTSPHVEWSLPDGSWRLITADRAVPGRTGWIFLGNVQQRFESNSLPSWKPPAVARLDMPGFSETPEEINSQINISYRHDNPTRTHRADVPIAEILSYLKLNPNPGPAMRSWLETKLQGRFAGPCTCLIVVLIGVPFAVGSGRRNVFVGVAASISIFFAYYILQQFGFALGEAGRVPAWVGSWLPNLVFGGAGVWMTLRVN